MQRCRVEGDREKRGWYVLHELPLPSGDLVLVGTYGVWRGNDNGAQKIELRKRDAEFSAEQREASLYMNMLIQPDAAQRLSADDFAALFAKLDRLAQD